MIPPVLAILQHCPCPTQKVPPTDHQSPTYSLWYLEPIMRRSWLMSLLVILYKVSNKLFLNYKFIHNLSQFNLVYANFFIE